VEIVVTIYEPIILLYPIAVNGGISSFGVIYRETWKHEVLPTSPTPNVPTAVSACAEDNSTQPIVVSADTNENSIHHEPTVITEPAITVSQPQTKPSEFFPGLQVF